VCTLKPDVEQFQLDLFDHNKTKQKIAGTMMHDEFKSFPTCFESIYPVLLPSLQCIYGPPGEV